MSVKTFIKRIVGATSPLLIRKSVMTATEAEKLLNAYSPRPTGSCVALNTMKPEVDLQIIVPAYNVERFIADCLESVVQQKTKYSFLATVVNDGATDHTGEIIEEYHTKYPELIEVITQENKGLSGARNTALSCLKGRYITFLDSDDLLEQGAVEYLMRCAQAEDADIVQGNWTEFVIGGGMQQIAVCQPSGFPWGKAFRASVLKDFRFPEGYWFEDTPVSYILYGMKYKIRNTDSFVYRYRINPNGITATSSGSPRSVETYYITELCLQEFPAFQVPYDMRAYEYFLRQCRMNWQRTKQRPRKVREAMFVLEAKLQKQYFTGMKTQENRKLEEALEKRQFDKFEAVAWSGR